MVRVCAWCQRYLGIKHPHQGGISHGICRTCAARQQWKQAPVLVVSPELEHVLPVLEELLRGKPEIRVVLDRRGGERRNAAERRKAKRRPDVPRNDRRKGDDPRRGVQVRVAR
jgi:hypothetical protein